MTRQEQWLLPEGVEELLPGRAAVIERLRRRLNFGFDAGRRAGLRGINGKMSEYSAAVAHAALDRWPETRAALARLCDAYDAALAEVPGLTPLRAPGETSVSGAYAVRLHAPHGRYLVQALAAHGIEARCWWQPILPEHTAFARYPGTPQIGCRRIAEHLVNLPMHSALGRGDVAQAVVVQIEIRAALQRLAEPGYMGNSVRPLRPFRQ